MASAKSPEFHTSIARVLLLMGVGFLLAAPSRGAVVKGGSSSLDALAFSSRPLRVTVTLADSEAIQGLIGNAAEIAAFKAEHGTAWHFTMDKRIGRVNLLDGGAIPFIPGPANTLRGADFDAPCGNASCVPVAQVEKIAREFLAKYQKIFLVDPAELELDLEGSHPVWNSIYTLSFQWKYKGIPVDGAVVSFIINSGNLIQMGMRNIGAISLDPTPALSLEAAWRILDGYVGGLRAQDTVLDPGTLAILPVTPKGLDPDVFNTSYGCMLDYVLVYRLAFQRPGITGTWEARVDAHTGELLRFADVNNYGHVQGGVYKTDWPFTETTVPFPYADWGPQKYCDAMGNFPTLGYYSALQGPTGGPGVVGGVAIMDLSCTPGAPYQTPDANGLIDFGNAGASGTNCAVPAGGNAGDTHAARNQYWHLNQMKAKAFSYFPSNTWLQSQLISEVNNTGDCNAYWNPKAGILRFFQSIHVPGTDCVNTGEIPSITYHEFGHGLDNNDGSIWQIPDNNPLEARADWTAVTQTHLSCAGNGWNPASFCSGYGDACMVCNGIRELDYAGHLFPYPWTPQNNRQTGGADPHYDCEYDAVHLDNGPCGWEDHCESGIATQALWDFVNRDLTGSLNMMDLPTAWQLADRLFYAGMSVSYDMYSCIPGSPTLSDGCGMGSLYNVMRAMDDDGDGTDNGTPHAAAIYAALARHNIACGGAGDVANHNHSHCPGLAAVTAGGSAFDSMNLLTWTPMNLAMGYSVFRNENGCDWGFTKIGSVAAPGQVYTDMQVYNGLTYYYRIQPDTWTDACAGDMSNCITLTPHVCANPGVPVITSITDADPCAVSGIRVNFTAGSGAAGHDLYRDGAIAVASYVSGALYNPGDASSHTYVVRAVDGTCHTDSAGFAFSDGNGTPGAPAITGITDVSVCAQNGIIVNYTGGSGAARHDLLKDGAVAATGYASGAIYNPGDSNSHTYGVRAVNGTCSTDSAGSGFSDANNSPGAPVIKSITDNNPCAQDGIKVNFTAGSGAASHNLLKDGTMVVTGYTSGSIYNPGDTSSHTYKVRAVSGNCTTDSAGSAFTDANLMPGVPAIGAVTVTGPDQLQVTWTPGSPAGATYNIYRADGACPGGAYVLIKNGLAASPWTDTSVVGGNSYSYKVTAVDGTGTCESPASGCAWGTACGPTAAVYNASYKAPACIILGTSCDTGSSILHCKGSNEPNAPNTVNSSCPDGSAGTCGSDESVERIAIAANDNLCLASGKAVTVTAVFNCSGSALDSMSLYYATSLPGGHATPSWKPLGGAIKCSGGGLTTITQSFKLSGAAGSVQAVRAEIVRAWVPNSAPPACASGSYNDRDDLVFKIK